MANNVQKPENDLMVETKGKLELFFDKHGNKILWTLIIAGLVLSAFFLIKNFSDNRHAQKEKAASVAMGNELNGTKSVEGFDKIQTEYELLSYTIS